MNDLSRRLDEAFDFGLKKEEPIKANVKKDRSVANISGQAKTPGDIVDQEKMTSGEIELEDIIDKINALRAGHSLKDKEIALSLEEYFTGLEVAEKTALFAYIKALSEIVSGIKPGTDAVEPDDKEPDVEMQKQNLDKKSDKSPETLQSKSKSNVATKKANVTINKNAPSQQQTKTSSPETNKKALPITVKQ